MARGGADLSASLAAMAVNASTYSPTDRHRLLEMLALALTQIKDFNQAKKLWLEVAKLDPNDLALSSS